MGDGMTEARVATILDKLRTHGARRVILLGSPEEMARGALKAALARAGILVLVPPERDRAWLGTIMRDELWQCQGAREVTDYLTTLLADGIEHGVNAILVMDEKLCTLVSACDLPVPVLYVGESVSEAGQL